jgi:ubiquinone/menaquinone biosynthesis C-methylase UbiE
MSQTETDRPIDKYGFQLRPVVAIGRLIGFVSAAMPGLRPRLQTALVRAVYSSVSLMLKDKDSAEFMNYGYTPLGDNTNSLKLDPADEADRVSIQLYFRVAGSQDLHGKDVLEVGSGRGGGASFIARYLHPASMTGVDLSASAVRYCRRRHRIEGLTFLRGDAGNLPLPSSSFDAVVNVESSHSYPSFERFLNEVARVLRPDGRFLFADARKREDFTRIREQLQERFTIVEEELITANVIRACEMDSDRRIRLIERRAPRFLQKGMQAYFGVKGGSVFDSLASGEYPYIRFVLQKKSEGNS